MIFYVIAAFTMKAIQDIAVKTFVRALPDEIASIVDTREPKNVELVLTFAKQVLQRRGEAYVRSFSSYRTNYRDKNHDMHRYELDMTNRRGNVGNQPSRNRDTRLWEPPKNISSLIYRTGPSYGNGVEKLMIGRIGIEKMDLEMIGVSKIRDKQEIGGIDTLRIQTT